MTAAQPRFGLDIKGKWVGKLRRGEKTVELRAYDIPEALKGQEIALIQTPDGIEGVSNLGDAVEAGDPGAKLVGTVLFGPVMTYTSEEQLCKDESRHLVGKGSAYGWQSGQTTALYGWPIEKTGWYDVEKEAPAMRRHMRSIYELLD